MSSIDSAYHIPLSSVSDVSAHVEALTMKPADVGGFAGDSFPAYRMTEETLSVPRFYGIQHFGPASQDNTAKGEPISVEFKGEMTPLQTQALSSLDGGDDQVQGGMLVLPCGFGKTVCALKRICDVGVRTLVIVAKSFLMDQWEAQARKFTTATIGRIQRDTVQVGDITMAMAQSLYAREYGEVLGRFGMVVVDEAHHMAARAFSQALWQVPACRVLGLSATPHRKDGLSNLLYWSMGEIRFRASRGAEEALNVRQRLYEGAVVPDRVGRDGKINMQMMVTALTKDAARTRRIACCVEENVALGHCVLVLSDRVEHLSQIASHLSDVRWYIGKTPPAERKRTEEEGKIVLSTFQMAKEGLDIRRLSCIVRHSCFWVVSLFIHILTHPPPLSTGTRHPKGGHRAGGGKGAASLPWQEGASRGGHRGPVLHLQRATVHEAEVLQEAVLRVRCVSALKQCFLLLQGS